MDQLIKEIISIIINMEKENVVVLMDQLIKVFGKMIKKNGKGIYCGADGSIY
jgi:hypothetical protein